MTKKKFKKTWNYQEIESRLIIEHLGIGIHQYINIMKGIKAMY